MDHSPDRLRVQYATTSNLDARLALHERFSRHPIGWLRWLLDQYDFAPGPDILEVGYGAAYQWKGDNHERIDASWQVMLTEFSVGTLSTAREATSGLGFTYANANAMAIPFHDNAFGRVIANHMLYLRP